MDTQSFCDLFRIIFEKNQLTRFCSEPIMRQFEAFTALLQETNAHTNLTAIREVPEIIAKHYADCLLAEPFFRAGATVLDVGCGGGFPTVPLAIARPDLQITALDSTAKKIDFVKNAAGQLHLHNVQPICARVEDKAMAKYKGSFDVGTSRAVAKLSVLVELILPYIKTGGSLIALKGAAGDEELRDAGKAIRILGGEIREIRHILLSGCDKSENRTVIHIQKVAATPPEYPRQYAAMLKKPL